MPADPANNALVIGFGNPLRQDDGIGPYVVSQIAARALPGLQTLVVHQLTPELAEPLSRAARAVFVDACRDPAGEPVEIRPIRGTAENWTMSHISDPRILLRLTHALYRRVPDTWTVHVRGMNFAMGEGLSDRARRHADDAVERVIDLWKRTAIGYGNCLTLGRHPCEEF